MKKTNQTLQVLFAGMAAVLVLQANSSAQTITPLNAATPVVTTTIPSNVGPAGTTGAGGYDFFYLTNNSVHPAVSADVASLPSYISDLTVDSSVQRFHLTSPTITVGTTTYDDGLLYSPTYGTTPADPQTFVTIELASGVPSAFDLGIMQDYSDNTVYTLSLYSGTPSSATLLTSAPISDGVETNPARNQFFYGEISGASAGDYIVITGAPTGGSNQVTLGGITFDTVAAPEPGTVALMLGGLGALALVARLRRSNG